MSNALALDEVLALPGVRPLSARSIVASTLLGTHPPELPVRSLVGMGELFGVSEGAVRVALSRMAAEGDLAAGDGRYRLTGRLVERQARQEESRHPTVRPWSGHWSTAVVVAQGRSPGERAELRAAMTALHMAELREGVWMRPDNLDTARDPAARAVAAGQCRTLSATPQDGDDADLASSLWDLAGWQMAAERYRGAVDDIAASLDVGDDRALAPGFVLSAAVLRHLLADPLLPDELLPAGWPGSALRREYDAFDSAFRAALRDWSIRHA